MKTEKKTTNRVMMHSVPKASRGSARDLTGQRFEHLVVLYPLDPSNRTTTALWRCRCDCGNEVNVTYHALTRGNNKSCGCLKKKYQALVHDRLHLIDGTCVEWLVGRKSRVDNASGFRGVFKKKNGKYLASIGFKKKVYYLGTFDDYDEAVAERLVWESLIHDGFVRARSHWVSMAAEDPEWARHNPFVFDLVKENGDLRIINSMENVKEAFGAPLQSSG